MENDRKLKKGGFALTTAFSTISYSTSFCRFAVAASSVALVAVSITFSFVGSAVSSGLGYYFMGKHVKNLLDEFQKHFIQNADRLSDSLLFGINYLKNMAELYKKLSN